MKSIDERISYLFDLNRFHSKEFLRSRLWRHLYRSQHPTEICAFKCMDGRIHIPLVTNTPLGIIRPYRNIGGYFDLGWPLLGEDLKNWVDYGISKGRKSLILVTYHYSCGDNHRGCAGFHYDTEAAFNFTKNFHQQVNRMFGIDNNVVFPIVMGLETDNDSLIFHPEDPSDKNGIFYVTEDTPSDGKYLLEILESLYPKMDSIVREDMIPLIQGNIAHVKELKKQGRDLSDMQHREWVLGLGRGFDWLHEPNKALIVGPFDPDLSKPVSRAISIIENNMNTGQIPNDGFLILASAPYREVGIDKNRAIEKANFFRGYAKKILAAEYPHLLEKVRLMSVVVDENTRKIEQVGEI